MRIVAKTTPMRQWEVARELRARVKAALDAAGVAPAGPDTIVITAPAGSGSQAAAVRPSAAAAVPPPEELAAPPAEEDGAVGDAAGEAAGTSP
jgi:small conductance mechanosensitive channel